MILNGVSHPRKEQGSVILYLNCGPDLLMHLKPTSGAPRPVGMAIADHLFPREDGPGAGRIPLVGIVGTRSNAFIARLVGWLLQLSGRLTGVASSEGMFLANRRTQKTDTANWAGAHRLLTNRLAQAAVIQTTARSILEEGLAYDRCLVGVVTDMDGYESLADHDVLEQAKMTRVLRTQIDVVLDEGAGVLNADIAQVAELASLCDGEVLLYSTSADNAAVSAHRANTENGGEGRAGGSGDQQRGAGLLGHVAGGGVGRLPQLAAGPVARVGAVGDAAAGEVLGLGRDVVYPRVHVLAQVVYAAVGLVQRAVGHVACGLHGIAGAVEDVVCGLVRRLQCFLGRGLNCHECVLSWKMRGAGVCLRAMRVRS